MGRKIKIMRLSFYSGLALSVIAADSAKATEATNDGDLDDF